VEAIILQTRQDVALARPGVRPYVVQSGSDAYFPAMALIEDRSAQMLGEAFTAAGHIVTLRVLRASAVAEALVAEAPLENPPPIYHTMTMGPEMFAAIFREYSDWAFAWWREAVQNSVDAGAHNITLGTRTNPDQTVTVWCDDDGSGMDQETMIQKFLAFSGTTKTSTSGTAGGFGEAKKLLVLPWISWRIHTRNVLTEGVGSATKITETTERRGTRLEVVMPADKCTRSAKALAFIARCNLPHVRFTVEGDNTAEAPNYYPRTPRAALAVTGGHVIETIEGKAEVYFIPSPKKGETQPYMYVRTRGLYMFERYVSEVPGLLIVELTAPSIEVLMPNRDSLRDRQFDRALSQLAERIAIDKMSALKSEKGLTRKKYEGIGKFESRARAAAVLEQVGPTAKGPLPAQTVQVVVELISQMDQTQQETPSAMPSTAATEIMLEQKFLGPDHLEAALKLLVWRPDFYLVNDIEDFKIPKKFFPESMTPTVLKLAKVWAELCRYVLGQLGASRRYGVGFHFSTSLAASCIQEKGREGEVEGWLMLNPFKDFYERKEIWRTTDADLKWLYAAAIHECTHLVDRISFHDETFASALTDNMAKCADGYRKIRAIAAGIKMRGAPELTPERSTKTG
jgi:Histidine kinase-, DNA gyrase B-, and HSP90-like ATPase